MCVKTIHFQFRCQETKSQLLFSRAPAHIFSVPPPLPAQELLGCKTQGSSFLGAPVSPAGMSGGKTVGASEAQSSGKEGGDAREKRQDSYL